MVGWLVADFNADCLTGPKPISGVPSVGVFLRDPSPYLREFWRKPRKTPNGYVDKRDQRLKPASPIYPFFESRTSQRLVRRLFIERVHFLLSISYMHTRKFNCTNSFKFYKSLSKFILRFP